MIPIDLTHDSEYLLSLQRQAEAEGCQCIVGGLIINADGRVFAQKRAAHRKLFPGCWDIVGGHVDPGEALYQALAREIAEETGWQLERIIALVDIFDWETTSDGQTKRNREFDFVVEVVGNLKHPQIEQPEFSEYRWIGKADLPLLMENRQPGDEHVFRLAKRALEMYSHR